MTGIDIVENEYVKVIGDLYDERCKFVQFYDKKEIPYFAIGAVEAVIDGKNLNGVNHGTILDYGLDCLGIPYDMVKLGDNTYHAKRKSDSGLWEAVGVGVGEISDNVIILHKNSNSKGYPDIQGVNFEHMRNFNALGSGVELVCLGKN